MLQNLWGVLPLAAYAGLTAGQVRRGHTAMEALLRAAVWWAAGIWILSNALSLFNALRPEPLRIAWALLAAAALADAFRRRGQWHWPYPSGADEWAAALGIGTLLLLALVTALLAPPVTVDVLNYHLPRQLMWLQQGSLAHYITVNDRELMMPPLAEAIGVQWLALTGDDRWANLPQWFAYALLPVALLRTARSLGLSRSAAVLAAWLAVCIPMAWHEASNGKNDLQGALWLALLLGQVARARPATRAPSRSEVGLAGVTLALAMLTKSTALLFAPPLLVVGWLAWRRSAWGGVPLPGGNPHSVGRAGLIAVLAATVLTAPFFARNFAWYGTPLGIHHAQDGGKQGNEAATPAIVTSNGLRNASLHLALPWPTWNAGLERAVRIVHGWIGLSPDDPRSTLWTPVLKYAVSWEPAAETVAGAPAHFVLIAIALLTVWWRREWQAWRWLATAVAAMALLDCVVLKWQPWGARLQLPVFVTGSLLVAAMADRLPSARRRGVAWGLAALGLLGWWPAHDISARPLWTSPTLWEESRTTNYYRYHPEFLARDLDLAQMVRTAGVREVALVSRHDSAYPLMRRLRHEVPGVLFYGAPATDAVRAPEAILALELGAPLALFYDWPPDTRYRLTGSGAGDGLYLSEARVRTLGWERRLPAFAGWTSHANLPLRMAGLAPVTRVITGTTATVFFPGWEGRARFTGTVQRTATTAEQLDLTINGVPAGRVEFRAMPGSHDFEVWLPCRPGTNTLEMRRLAASSTEREIIFTRLQIDDGAGAAGP